MNEKENEKENMVPTEPLALVDAPPMVPSEEWVGEAKVTVQTPAETGAEDKLVTA